MKLILFLSTLIISQYSYCQITYCEIFSKSEIGSSKYKVYVDKGTLQNSWSGNPAEKIMDTITDKPQKFNSMIEALNYMSTDGWQLVQVYTTIYNKNTTVRYLLSKSLDVKEEVSH